MKKLDSYPLNELKLIYRVLHAQLPQHMDLMDAEILADLQRYLMQKAQAEEVDVSLHQAWAAWLNEMNNKE